MDRAWANRERNTARFVQACLRAYLPTRRTPRPELLYALCKLTWITTADDNTRAVTAPAMSILTGSAIEAASPAELASALRDIGGSEELVRPAARPIGFTNFYAGFRSIARTWCDDNVEAVWPIVRAISSATNDRVVQGAYAVVDELPPLPRKRAGSMQASNLLTPLLACLEPRKRAPIINSRHGVVRRLRQLGLGRADLVEQCTGLMGLIGQAGIKDAFDLDVWQGDVRLARKRRKKGKREALAATGRRRPLQDQESSDVEYFRTIDRVKMRRLHNAMTSRLRALCQHAGLQLEKGGDRTSLFDALIPQYSGTERHLLIEVKTDCSMPMCRMAVGQLFDYRRGLDDRAAVDLAVLLPEQLDRHARAYFADLGIHVLWFTEGLRSIRGDARIAGIC